jgi:hypothetical protein
MSQVDPDSDIRERRFAGVKHAEIPGFAYSQKNTRSADAAFPSGALVHEAYQFHFEKKHKINTSRQLSAIARYRDVGFGF